MAKGRSVQSSGGRRRSGAPDGQAGFQAGVVARRALNSLLGTGNGPRATRTRRQPDGGAVAPPEIKVRFEGERYRFLPSGNDLVYMQGLQRQQDFWVLDLATQKSHLLTRLRNTVANVRRFPRR